MSIFKDVEGTFRVLRLEDDPTPIGMIVPGDCRRMRGHVVRLTSPAGVRTIHCIADARYEEGETTFSFRADVDA